jgi:hypothetical protein
VEVTLESCRVSPEVSQRSCSAEQEGWKCRSGAWERNRDVRIRATD